MIKKKRLALIMTVFLAALMLASVSFAYSASDKNTKKESSKDAAKETAKEVPVEPLREVHKVSVGDKSYCFFVTNNVVITPEEIAKMTDEELTAWILKCAGLYMKETNCKLETHKAITTEAWAKTGGRFLLYEEDITNMRGAVPEDGNPYKLYMDLEVSNKPAPQDPSEQDEENLYSTFKTVSPNLLFVVIATATDAAQPEDICESPARKPEKQKKVKLPKTPSVSEEKELLPEQRTIRMTDRSGGPIEDTLQDGTPVKLEWIEPSRHPSPSGSFKPGSNIGLAIIIAALAALLVLIIRKLKKKDED